MLAFLTSLLEFLRAVIWPVFIVSEPNRGVRYTFGSPRILTKRWWLPRFHVHPVLEPGAYFAFPFFQEIRQTSVAEDVLDVTNLPITTRDDVQATVSYNLRYRVDDVLKFQLSVQNASSSIHAEAACEVALRMRRRTWPKIYRSQGAIERRMTKTLTERFHNWGIQVINGGVTICAKARPISLIHVE